MPGRGNTNPKGRWVTIRGRAVFIEAGRPGQRKVVVPTPAEADAKRKRELYEEHRRHVSREAAKADKAREPARAKARSVSRRADAFARMSPSGQTVTTKPHLQAPEKSRVAPGRWSVYDFELGGVARKADGSLAYFDSRAAAQRWREAEKAAGRAR